MICFISFRTKQCGRSRQTLLRHSMVHFLDVARIGTIIALEEGLKINREWIYAAALLHDCGKHEQYENGIPHEQASARIAPEILKACGFNDEETGVIVTAISRHRDPEAAKEKNLKWHPVSGG